MSETTRQKAEAALAEVEEVSRTTLPAPVDANEIALPTDGFQSASELEQFLGYKDNNGISGATRPGPRAADEDAPPPDVSNIDPAAIVPGRPQPKDRRADDGDKRKRERNADASTGPGFSF